MYVFCRCTSFKSLADALRRLRFSPRSASKSIDIKNTIYLIAIPNRDMDKIPHPFVVESIERFQSLPQPRKPRYILYTSIAPIRSFTTKVML